MDIQAYIATGILESYVLGITSPEETEEVKKLAEQHPQIKAEVEAIRTSLEAYIMQYEKMPPESLKKKVWHKIEQLEEGNADSAYTKATNHSSQQPIKALVEKNRFKSYLVAASITGLLLSLGFNIYLFSQLNQTRQKLAEATVINSRLAQDLQINQANYTRATEQLAILNDPANKVIFLEGLETAPDAAVVVYWNTSRQQVYLSVRNLPPPGPDMQYQLWAIVDNKPVDAGMLEKDVDALTLQKMRNIGKAQAFAITLEKKGGSSTPQGKMYVLGKV